MSTSVSSVLLVLDPEAGEKLRGWRRAGEPLWVVDSAVNTPVITAIWAEAVTPSDVSTFPPDPVADQDALFLRAFDLIELHHVPHDGPAYSALRVIGLSMSPVVHSALEDAGLDMIEDVPLGFIARAGEMSHGRNGRGQE